MWDSSAGFHLYHTDLYMINFGFTILRMHATDNVLISCMQEVYATRSQSASVVYGLQWLLNYLKDQVIQPGELPQSVTIAKTLNLVMFYHC